MIPKLSAVLIATLLVPQAAQAHWVVTVHGDEGEPELTTHIIGEERFPVPLPAAAGWKCEVGKGVRLRRLFCESKNGARVGTSAHVKYSPRKVQLSLSLATQPSVVVRLYWDDPLAK